MAGKLITLKYAGRCRACRETIDVGEKARWSKANGRSTVICVVCLEELDGEDLDDYDEAGISWVGGRGVRSDGMCEDAPACGCCGPNQEGSFIVYG